jgi:hypothetical protein
VARAEAFAGLDDERELDVLGEALRQPARRRRDAEPLERLMREVLVAHLGDDLRGRQEDGGTELVAGAGEGELIEVGQRDDEIDTVLLDEAGQRRDVLRVADARHELVPVGVVERGREAVDVGRDRRRAGPAEGGHDVDALPSAREENRRHGERA